MYRLFACVSIMFRQRSYLFFVVLLSSFVFTQTVLGEEPEIRVILMQCSDVEPASEEKIIELKAAIKSVQLYYKNRMLEHGYEGLTFKTEEDFITAKTRNPLRHYNDRVYNISDDIWDHTIKPIKDGEHVIQIVFVLGAKIYDNGAAFYGVSFGRPPWGYQWTAVVPTENEDRLAHYLAHELGHTFQLAHHSDPSNLMYGQIDDSNDDLDLEDRKLTKTQVDTIKQNPHIHYELPVPEFLAQNEFVVDADVNDDGYVDLYDVMIVRSGMSTKSSYDTDINNDGVTNILDLMLVKAAAFEAIAAAAPPRRKVITTTWGELKKR